MENKKLTNKIKVLFRIVELLQAGNYTASQLSELVGIPNRTLHRYLLKIEDIGFVIDKDFKGRFFINNSVVPDFLKGYLKTAA